VKKKRPDPGETGKAIRRMYAEQLAAEVGMSADEIEAGVKDLINKSLRSMGKEELKD
jgi:hypothetical protein